ncbi:MAG: aldehyde ferredoxin oxidoreductase family protein [Caldilineales bacterium]|nr:aldehyde ferredoxin oxidoreductase family protein [Caldilineales bacterium]
MNSYGYHGKILHIYLNELRLEVETPPESFYRKYVGGSAMGLYYVLKNTPANADPFGPENTLALMLSVLTGAPISGQSRITSVAKSPLTDAIGDSQAGGFFPAEVKYAGFDGIIVHGRAAKPVYLWIKDGVAELRSAEHLWGKTTGEVEDILQAELEEPRLQVLQTGIAGANLVRFAALINMANRANGRTGMGAVMASKNLKAIAVRGKLRPDVADAKGLNALAKQGAKDFPDSDVYGMGLLGTAEVLRPQNRVGGLPTHNWDSGVFEDGWEAISGERMSETILKERDTCYACTVRCKRVVEISDGPYIVDPRYGGPEYETLATFGSYCNVDDLAAIAYANQLCGMYGMDTISCGATIAWAMDCFEHGLLTAADTGGVELRFGDAGAMTKMVEMIARRQGFGDVLAEGSARAAEIVGRGTEELVVAVKKSEAPAHMPEVKRSLELVYAVNPFGADHQSSEHDPSYRHYPERMAMLGLTDPQPNQEMNEEKVRYALQTQYFYSALDTFNICQFVFGPAWHLYGPDDFVDMVHTITGWDVDISDIQEVGARRLNMLRAFNAREGFGREDDSLPQKMFKPKKGGRSDGVALNSGELEWAKDEYYRQAGWDAETGAPTRETLESLDLAWVADMLS